MAGKSVTVQPSPRVEPAQRSRSWPCVVIGIIIASAAVAGGCLSLDGGAAAQTDYKLNNHVGKVIRYEVTGSAGMAESVTYVTNNGLNSRRPM